jgi:hypothetical protein
MKHVLIVAVLFTSLVLTSCSELKEDQSLVSYQMEKSVRGPFASNNFAYLTKFNSIPVKEWKPSTEVEGIEITLATNMQEFDYVFAIVEQSQLVKSELIFLQKIDDIYLLSGFSNSDVKDIRVYGIRTAMEIGNYPYSLLSRFSNLGVDVWGDGGAVMKVVASEWNTGDKDLFAEIYSDTEGLLVYVGNPGSKEFELPKFELRDVNGINLFATKKVSELPIETDK